MVNPQIFRQYDIRGVVDKDLTNETLYLIGKGYGTFLRRQDLKTVAIAGDARLSTPRFKEQFIKAIEMKQPEYDNLVKNVKDVRERWIQTSKDNINKWFN